MYANCFQLNEFDVLLSLAVGDPAVNVANCIQQFVARGKAGVAWRPGPSGKVFPARGDASIAWRSKKRK